MQLGDETLGNVNLFGAPCGVQPPFSHEELRQNYLGCQNLPTALWVMKLKKASSSAQSSNSASSSATSQSNGGRQRARQVVDSFGILDS
jgi:hypothetical protein